MTGPFDEPADATPLTAEDQLGLRPSWIATRADLNDAEQDNILKALAWARRRRQASAKVATEQFSRQLHTRMFGDVWSWAGRYRTTQLNLGVEPWRIAADCAQLFDDFTYWIDHRTFPADELGVRFHHRIVSVHPFPNGNGRHSRLMADLLVESLGHEPFTWGSGNLQATGALRRTYVDALRAADAGDMAPLTRFARS